MTQQPPEQRAPTAAEKAALLRTVGLAQAAEIRSRRAHLARQRALAVSVARALSGGVPAADLADRLGVSRQRVYQIRDEALAPRQET